VGASVAAWLVQGMEAAAGVDEAEVGLGLACWLLIDVAESAWRR